MVGPNARHRRRRAVVDGDPDRDPSLERNRDPHCDRDPSLECNRDPHCDRDLHCDSIYADNGDTDFDAEHNR